MKKVLVRGPVLTQSGYGEHTRLVLRSLRSREEELDLYLISTSWGATNWIFDDNEERAWLDALIQKTSVLIQQKQMPQPDITIQVTIPLEWEKIAPVNIGITAGIETTKMAGEWIEKCNLMDKIIVPSEFARYAFDNTSYDAQNQQTGEVIKGFKNETPIEVIPYPTKEIEADPDFSLDLTTDFNFLAVAQWGPRKNLENLIKWFIEENFDRENVGLILKTNRAKNCEIDRDHCVSRFEPLLSHEDYKDRKCKIYLLHGYMTEEEMAALYRHDGVKAFITTTHGEGFGLPLFDAAQAGLPIIAPAWSGHTDFLTMPVDGKNKFIPQKIDFDIKPIQKESVWDKVLVADSMWCYPKEGSFKMKMRSVMEHYNANKKKATKLAKWLQKEWPNEEELYDMLLESFNCIEVLKEAKYVFVSDMFKDQYVGGAELSLQALIDNCKESYVCINSGDLNEKIGNFYKDSIWIFGNISKINNSALRSIVESDIKYHFVEFDYKFCEYRNPLLYEFLEGEKCDYSETDRGRVITSFINNSIHTFLMSEEQQRIYLESLNDLDSSKFNILSSIFNDDFFDKISSLRKEEKNKTEKWLVLGSKSWVKGAEQSESWCKENNLDYDVVFGLQHHELLDKLASAKGIVFKPTGLDTCPRYVIEAKLLGCDLELNENVQHTNEEWFAAGDINETISYLKSRKSYFWDLVENEQ
jgi:hypothetical protein